ncbi:hypothetical protein LCGC14_2137490, partial [marine sediment metagenome]
TYNKLFEDGDFYITDEESNMVGFKRDSVIIHPCPHPSSQDGGKWANAPFNITMVMPYGEYEGCYYCGQRPSDALVAVYKLQNFDHFASDGHEVPQGPRWTTKIRKFPSRNG